MKANCVHRDQIVYFIYVRFYELRNARKREKHKKWNGLSTYFLHNCVDLNINLKAFKKGLRFHYI